MELQYSGLILSKEITWDIVEDCKALCVEMMRHRVTINAKASLPTEDVDLDLWKTMWDDLKVDIRKFCDLNNSGLYCFTQVITPKLGNRKVPVDRYDGVDRMPDNVTGSLSVLFEYHSDYDRFLRDVALQIKLSINT
jgi:hypothetical protein